MARVYNFGAGPATLPVDVLQEAQADLVDYKGSGMSIMEMSHRGKEYDAVHNEAVANIKELLGLNDDYAVLFLQGGASLQFAMLPMNFLGEGQTADYVNAGSWGAAAVKQARLIGNVSIAADCQKDIPTRMPELSEMKWTPGAVYSHITTNETISGAQFKALPETGSPLIADMSSDILSRPLDYTRCTVIYAGAQKNLGPSGVALVAIRKDFAEKGNISLPAMLRYQTHIENNSLYNTPPCFSIYMLCLTTRWLKKVGPENLFKQNRDKAQLIYDAIDASGFYRGTAKKEYRSDMNVTFRLPTEELETLFIKQASEAGMKQLKGHRSVGGIRASIYNAFPVDGVQALVAFMKDFEARNG
ncbi:MAG TPA: 3-phosphoserine/phosphohydroxythreonine transaminase [Kiritimatiellia bacterium]|nr:MAG: Phosphoserine aminotransferase [Verrucomicrobia bacterium ADurb.Bin070]HQQ92733.1 3-phosphoserine/phosphohydroxythreonine transaminase [Kiritimatiellia bacterium]